MYKISVTELTEIETVMEVECNRCKVKKKKKSIRKDPAQAIAFLLFLGLALLHILVIVMSQCLLIFVGFFLFCVLKHKQLKTKK